MPFCVSLYSLSDLEGFIKVTETGFSRKVEEGDYAGLVEIMGHLMAVKERQSATDEMFEPLQHTIDLLKTYEQELPEVVYKQLEVIAFIIEPNCQYHHNGHKAVTTLVFHFRNIEMVHSKISHKQAL